MNADKRRHKNIDETAQAERAAIDADLAGMAEDEEYQAEAELIMREFAHSDWEAFQAAEREYAGDEKPVNEPT